MDFSGFYHENKSRFAYPVNEHTLHIRLRAGANAADAINLLVIDPYEWIERDGKYILDPATCRQIPMTREYVSYGFDWWFALADIPTKRAKYAFIAEKNGDRYFCGDGLHSVKPFTDKSDISSMTMEFFIYPYILKEDIFSAPAWAKETVWYQIFPERFARSGKVPHPEGEVLPWGSQAVVSNKQIYGGDIPGVTSKLDYLQNLGITGIYMTPVFSSPSTHKYNTEDYMQIDPAFGTNADLHELVSDAHKRGMRVMLDLVFNHIGSANALWKDVEEKGKASKYFDWFYVNGDGSYETFAKVKSMPKWNTANHGARAYLIDVACYWARTFCIDGFRLDVANEVSHDFWRAFRKAVREVNPELYIVGEVWDISTPWLEGDQFDAVMNYKFYGAVYNFVSGKTDGRGLADALGEYLTAYPKDRQEVMFNLIGTHDTGRILSVAGGSTERAEQAFALLLTMAGSPCLCYGDEVGLAGEGMDDSRKCMEWNGAKQNSELLAFVKKLIALRKSHPALTAVDADIKYAGAEGIVYIKQAGDEKILVALETEDGSLNDTVNYVGGGYEEIVLDSHLVHFYGLRL